MTEPREIRTHQDLIALLDKIDMLLSEVRERVIDGDPDMQEELRKAKNGDE